MADTKLQEITESKENEHEQTNDDTYTSYDEHQKEIRIVIISDTHGHHTKLAIPPADILIHCGDFTNFSNIKHLQSFNEWLATIPIPTNRKLVVTGNHEIKANFELKFGCKVDWNVCLSNATLLHNKMVDLYGIKIYGHGWQGDTGYRNWNNIPSSSDIIITHNPPQGVLDGGQGCNVLKQRVGKIRPLMHCFGHIHSDYGIYVDKKRGTYYVNAAIVDHQRKPAHAPIVLKITKTSQMFRANTLSVDVMNKDKESLFRDIEQRKKYNNETMRYVN
eukprot:256834_1